MTTFTESIRKIMGWYPSVNSKIYKSNQPIQSGNIIFPANTFLFTLYLAIGLSLFSYISRYLEYPVLLIISLAMYVLYYFLAIKTFQASISIDENGVHFHSFKRKDITLSYGDIKSVKSVKWNSRSYSNNIRILLTVLVVILALSTILREWIIIILAVPALPIMLLSYREEKKRYHDLDTQLYIGSKKNKWYELSPYYSVITDKTTADQISKSIEQYMEG